MRLHRLPLAIRFWVVPIGLLAACSPVGTPDSPSVLAGVSSIDTDSSGRYRKDRGGSMLNANEQGRYEADRAVTQRVHMSLVDQRGSSLEARHVDIITRNLVVELRGAVTSEDDKARIELVAARVAGVRRIVNRIEVRSDP